MDPAFWSARWREGRIGFHEGQPNTFLARHAARLAGRVLVPLCGKTEDLAYLASVGHEVIGVELVEDAVRQFFAEHQATPAITKGDMFTEYCAGPVTILAGDVLATTRELLGSFDSIYDRAALVALPPEMRTRYVAHLRALASPGTRMLVITYEYPQEQFAGPPFAVMEAELRALYEGARVEVIDEAPDERDRPGPKATNRVFAITL